MLIRFTVPGQPVPWSRAGAKGKARFTPLKQRNQAAIIKDFGEQAMEDRAPVDAPVELSVLCVFPWPKTISKKRRQVPSCQWKISKPDVDNLVKVVKDALQGVCWIDDSRVCSEHVWKKYGDKPGVHIEWRTLDGAET